MNKNPSICQCPILMLVLLIRVTSSCISKNGKFSLLAHWVRFGLHEAWICLKDLWVPGVSCHTGSKVTRHQKWFFRRPSQTGFRVVKNSVSRYIFLIRILRKIIMGNVIWHNNIFCRKLNVLDGENIFLRNEVHLMSV